MRMQNPFAAISPTGVDSIVLSVLARSTGMYTTSDIMGLLPEKASREAVRQATARLVVQGVIIEQRAGILSMFTLNREHLLADAILAISKAKRTFIARLREEISSWPMQPVTVMLFGSAARNEMGDGSDIDLLVVVPDAWPEEENHIQQLSGRASLWTGNDVRPLVYTESEVADAPIFNSILTDGIDVAGDKNWLRKRIRKVQVR